jgi:p21-activated kinase 1
MDSSRTAEVSKDTIVPERSVQPTNARESIAAEYNEENIFECNELKILLSPEMEKLGSGTRGTVSKGKDLQVPDSQDTIEATSTVHPTIAKAFTGEHAARNRKTWEEIENAVSPGKVEDKYVLMEKLGSGADGTVYKGKAVKGGEVVAIKRMKLCREPQQGDLLIYKRHYEVTIMKELCAGPSRKVYNVPRYLDSYVVGDELWIVMEHIQGVSLFKAVERARLTPLEVATVFYHVLEAVGFMHCRDIMHNDIHWDNVILGANNEVKLIDFGLSLEIDENMLTPNVNHIHRAPELMKGEEFDSRIDIWAVGIMFYNVVFRQGPFGNERDERKYTELMLAHGKPPIPDGWKVDPVAADFLDKCLTVNPQERPSALRLLSHKFFHLKDVHSKVTVSRLVDKITGNMKK